jgi:hypothetical protein
LGGKSGGNSGTQQVQNTTFSVPEEFYPFVDEALTSARGEAYRPYEAYTGPRIAPFSDDRLQAFEQTRNLENVGQDQFNAGDATTGLAAIGAAGANYDPLTQRWDAATADQYMNPYMRQVLDAMTARAADTYGKERVARDARKMQSGAFGGYRQGVEEGVAFGQNQLGLNSTIADTLMKGYDTAYGQFNQDENRLDGSRRFDFTGDLQQAEGLAGIGNQFYNQGTARRSEELRGIGALNEAALAQERLTQASLDQGYNDFVNQRDYNRNNITWYNNIIRGNVTGANSNVVNTTEVNPYSQMLGLGIGAAGLFNAMGGQGGGGGGG